MLPGWASAETVFAAYTIRSHAILSSKDVVVGTGDTPGSFSDLTEVLGMETRNVIYKGRPVLLSDVGPAAVIERNQIITLTFASGPLSISAEARSLGRAGVGELVQVMNLDSRKTITGIVNASGNVVVGWGQVD